MNNLFTLIVIAMFIEAFITYIQTIFKENRIQWQVVIAFILAIAICYDTEINFFTILGLPEKWPIVGTIATAVVVCRQSKKNEPEDKKKINFID